ncbi:DUF1097 domain-containing protein [Clostridium felsineum]|uniref:Uncharacterized protein n=1 Tax=Clostridium felsineum TaxID=36839 RepID=A0A1S8LQS8_9CLOT|nr:DUF1097 domain-containing protein [Clostridium felsineum]MCR3759531.1 DUF1097 domain-containing protein [Clostridium felsineum]URZ07595.1 hypothetical protein CLROS_029340 [Clostridium felsineum]URZ12626.1 hypothetical protein CROST_033490 [Clostridium felsineum]URZ17268.1 hypothetical protein CLFE_033210 [Clostridium felsineum DSM 794]
MKIKKEILILAFCIAVFPPIWAVIAPHIGVTTGAVALICAGLYVTNGNKTQDAVKISLGFLMGDFWAVIALLIMRCLPFNGDVNLFIVLFVLGGVGVVIASALSKWIFCPSLLCGWAIGLTILAPVGYGKLGTLPIQIGIAMFVGVLYVGVMVNKVQGLIEEMFEKKN